MNKVALSSDVVPVVQCHVLNGLLDPFDTQVFNKVKIYKILIDDNSSVFYFKVPPGIEYVASCDTEVVFYRASNLEKKIADHTEIGIRHPFDDSALVLYDLSKFFTIMTDYLLITQGGEKNVKTP